MNQPTVRDLKSRPTNKRGEDFFSAVPHALPAPRYPRARAEFSVENQPRETNWEFNLMTATSIIVTIATLLIEALLGLRLGFLLTSANSFNPGVTFVYSLTQHLVFDLGRSDLLTQFNSMAAWVTVGAMAAYGVGGWVLARLLRVMARY